MNAMRMLLVLLCAALAPLAQAQYYDQETGLNYNVNRNYDASTDRYLESDPIGLAGGVNTYVYVKGNPLSYSDPDGLVPNPAEGACALGPNPVCASGVAADVITSAIAMVMASRAWVDNADANREWEAYKRAHSAPIPPDPNDPCKEFETRIEREKQLIKDRASWDAKYDPGRHDNALPQSLNRIRNLENKLEKCKKEQQQCKK